MKKKMFLGIIVVLWLVGLGALFQFHRVETLYSAESGSPHGAHIYHYDDRSEGGKSTNQFTENANGLRFQWSLVGSMAYPYIGGGLSWLRSGAKCVDWSNYDSLLIRWRLTGKSVARLALHNLDPVRSDNNDPTSLRILMIVAPVDSIWQRSRFAFKDWATPPWWYSQHRIAPNQDDRYMNAVCELEWDVPGNAGETLQGEFSISDIQLVRMDRRPFWGLFAFGIVISLALGLWTRTRKNSLKPKPQLDSLTKGISVETAQVSDWKMLEAYMKEHYQNPELSAEYLCKHFGWNATKFTAIVKEGSGLHFKQALNVMRIHAACTLLTETSEPISSISDRVGFSNVTHFNRVFKELHGMSPSEFRNASPIRNGLGQ